MLSKPRRPRLGFAGTPHLPASRRTPLDHSGVQVAGRQVDEFVDGAAIRVGMTVLVEPAPAGRGHREAPSPAGRVEPVISLLAFPGLRHEKEPGERRPVQGRVGAKGRIPGCGWSDGSRGVGDTGERSRTESPLGWWVRGRSRTRPPAPGVVRTVERGRAREQQAPARGHCAHTSRLRPSSRMGSGSAPQEVSGPMRQWRAYRAKEFLVALRPRQRRACSTRRRPPPPHREARCRPTRSDRAGAGTRSPR